MQDTNETGATRRAFMTGAGALLGCMSAAPASAESKGILLRLSELFSDDAVTGEGARAVASPSRTSPAAPRISGSQPRPALLKRALASLDRHARHGVRRDRIAVVDFSMPSSRPRMHVVDLASGRSWATLVSHGSGSDPMRTGWVERLSNLEGSNASCDGAFLTSDFYIGRHGRSQRLIGLDPTNDRAFQRAIVVHGAWYSEPDVVARTGALGRSQGCFAVGDSVLPELLARLGQGRMIFASKT